MENKRERLVNKQLQLKSFEEKMENGVNFGYFTGYGSVFNMVDCHDDVILQGAFLATIASGSRPKLFVEHSSQNLIGTIVSMQEDSYGLLVEGRINLGTEKGRDSYALLKAGDIDAMSIGYIVKKYSIDKATSIRTISEITLCEISLVVFPANELAKITQVKSLEELKSLSDCEKYLKVKGLANKESTAIVSCIKKILKQSESVKNQVECDTQIKQDILELTKTIQKINNNIQ